MAKDARLNFRVDDATHEEIKAIASEEGCDLSDVARRWMLRGKRAEKAERERVSQGGSMRAT